MTIPHHQAQNTHHNPQNPTNPPASYRWVLPIGLCLASLLLSLAGYGFRLMFGDEMSEVLRHAAVVVPVFVIGIPLMTWLGATGLNKLGKTNIHPRNAWTFGWLLSTVAMLSIMECIVDALQANSRYHHAKRYP